VILRRFHRASTASPAPIISSVPGSGTSCTPSSRRNRSGCSILKCSPPSP